MNMESDRQSEVRLQHTSVIRVELGSQERFREHIVVASLDTQGVMVFLQDIEPLIGKEE